MDNNYIICKKCSNKNESGTNYCKKCGNLLDSNSPKVNNKGVIPLLLACLYILIVPIGIWPFASIYLSEKILMV